MITAFEIQVFNNGDWRIDSIFDDEELATFEANRLFSRGLYDTVRVVKEIYNEMTNTASARTIAELTKASVAAPANRLRVATQAAAAATRPAGEGAKIPATDEEESGRKVAGTGTLWWLGLMAKSIGIAAGGLVFLFILRLLYEFL